MFRNQAHGRASRRDFLINSGKVGLAAAGTPVLAGELWAQDNCKPKPPQTQPAAPKLPHAILGKTGFPVTRISFGTVTLSDKRHVRLIRLAVEYGVNLIHTSHNYAGGNAARTIAQAFKDDPQLRDKIFLCIKTYEPQREGEIDEMLKMLDVDHFDLVLPTLHEADEKRMDAMIESHEALKKKGKIRFGGFVCHKDMMGVTDMVLKKGAEQFDAALLGMMMLETLHPDEKKPDSKPQPDEKARSFLKNLHALKAKGLGILSMKSGARTAVTQGTDVFGPHAKVILAAGADTLLTSITSRDQVEMIRRLELKTLRQSGEDRQAAAAFHRSRATACRMCGQCSQACPQGVPVADLMRIREYHTECGWTDHARRELAELGPAVADAGRDCGLCADCRAVCPVGLADANKVRQTVAALA